MYAPGVLSGNTYWTKWPTSVTPNSEHQTISVNQYLSRFFLFASPSLRATLPCYQRDEVPGISTHVWSCQALSVFWYS